LCLLFLVPEQLQHHDFQFHSQGVVFGINVATDCKEFVGRKYGDLFDYLLGSSLIALGLYRKVDNQRLRYIATNPRFDCEIESHDVVLVLEQGREDRKQQMKEKVNTLRLHQRGHSQSATEAFASKGKEKEKDGKSLEMMDISLQENNKAQKEQKTVKEVPKKETKEEPKKEEKKRVEKENKKEKHQTEVKKDKQKKAEEKKKLTKKKEESKSEEESSSESESSSSQESK